MFVVRTRSTGIEIVVTVRSEPVNLWEEIRIVMVTSFNRHDVLVITAPSCFFNNRSHTVPISEDLSGCVRLVDHRLTILLNESTFLLNAWWMVLSQATRTTCTVRD